MKTQMKKYGSLMIALIILISLFTACSGGSSASGAPASSSAPAASVASSDAASAASSEDIINIGYINPLTGEASLWGQCGVNALQMYADELNASGGINGKQVKIHTADSRMNPVDTVNAFNKLIDNNKIVACIGTSHSGTQIPLAAVADERKIPIISTGASNPKVTVSEDGKLNEFSFRVNFTDPYQGAVLASYCLNELKATKAAIITDIGNDYSVGLTQFFTEAFTANGGEITIKVEAHSGDNDFRAQLSKIQNSDPEVLFIPWFYKDVALMATQARDLGLDVPLFGGDGWDSKELPQMAGPVLEGCFFTSQPSFGRPETKNLYDAYVAKYNTIPENEALLTHDALYWIKEAIESTGGTDSDQLREYFHTTKDFQGLTGLMSVDPESNNVIKPVSINIIENNESKYLGDFSAN